MSPELAAPVFDSPLKRRDSIPALTLIGQAVPFDRRSHFGSPDVRLYFVALADSPHGCWTIAARDSQPTSKALAQR